MSSTISVAICTFNGSRFLPAQLQSIACQRRLPDEVVICDDASSDDSDAIAGDFARCAPFPVRIVRNQQNLGTSNNFQQAISMCRSSIIALADQDDTWYTNKLERIESVFLKHPATVAAFSDADLIDGDSHPLGTRLWNSFLFTPREQRRFANGRTLNVLVKHPVVTGATMAFRAEFRPLLLPIPVSQLHDSWISFLLAACGPFTPIPESLMQYRTHQSQQVGPGRASLRARFQQARKTGPRFYLREIERFHLLAERLQRHASGFPHAERALHEIDRKISHREHRACLPRAGIARIPKVLREVLNGGYWRYSEGWQSIAKDMAGMFSDTESLNRPAVR